MGKQRSQEGVELLRKSRVPVYRFPEEAASALAALVRYRTLRDAPEGRAVRFRVDRARARRAIAAARRAKRTLLSPTEARELLGSYGFPLVPARTVGRAADAIAAAMELGYPVVLKVESQRISHKTDVGGVRTDLRNADEVVAAFRDLERRLRRRDPGLKVQVQHMVRGGREVILGMSRDAQFGPVLLFGLGGIFTEVLKDVAIRIHPLTDVQARAMIEQVPGYPMLAGARGEPKVALPLLEQSLLRLSQMVGDFEGDLAELDINPLIVTSDAKQSFVVDCRVTLTG
jgi:acetyltransferase